MRRAIFVTDIDIKSGMRFLAYQCPLALAMNRVFDETIGVGTTTWWRKDDPFEEHPLPDSAISFRDLFDNRKKVIPFMYEIDDEDIVD